MNSNFIEMNAVIGNIVRIDVNKSKHVYIDIQFTQVNNEIEFNHIIFQNYYSSSLTVSQLNSNMEYIVILDNYKLMKDAYSEQDSQRWFTINSNEFNTLYEKHKSIRITLFQPCTYWESFELCNIKIYGKNCKNNHIPDDLTDNITKYNLLQLIDYDYNIISSALNNQKQIKVVSDLSINQYNAKKSAKKKDKRDKKKNIDNKIDMINDNNINIVDNLDPL